ncbi:MAG TPA: hypothetical protein VFH51_15865 [Myxococcota bacterium]|nr:hypothetical protein [Myxococcota bacterium]
MKPIAPTEAQRRDAIPDRVYDAFNRCISEHYARGSSTFLQSEVVDRLGGPAGLNYRWLDVEPDYEAAGWSVSYDRPGYNESYPASFTFKKKGD